MFVGGLLIGLFFLMFFVDVLLSGSQRFCLCTYAVVQLVLRLDLAFFLCEFFVLRVLGT